MTDQEFEALDELYFVQTFGQLKEKLNMEDSMLKDLLQNLIEKGWVKCFKSVSEELHQEEVDFESNFHNYCYLATKAGLFAHNSV